jgi:hypothetical protein
MSSAIVLGRATASTDEPCRVVSFRSVEGWAGRRLGVDEGGPLRQGRICPRSSLRRAPARSPKRPGMGRLRRSAQEPFCRAASLGIAA